MTRKFSINCDFGGQMSPFDVYIGKPEGKHHPLHFQSDWLNKERGGNIPAEIMDAVTKLKDLAEKNNVPLEDLCVYALGTEEEKREMDEAELEAFDEENEDRDEEEEDEDEGDESDPNEQEENNED